MITTIQVHEKVKQELDLLKRDRDSYEDVIERIIKINEVERRKDKQLLIEGYKEMAKDSLKATEEWEKADLDWD